MLRIIEQNGVRNLGSKHISDSTTRALPRTAGYGI